MIGVPGLELWGGVECTLNRVGEVYHDQVARSGHDRRPDDLRRFAELGIRAIRQPVLWEHVAPHGIATADWRASDERLATLRELGLRTIAGLVHHGSGPPHTSLVDESFVPGLVEYARAVAARYPWIDDYTPVNEPLTTARFSALYGVWYPHARDPVLFARAVLIQCRAIVLAMRAIREVNPHARLVQTEDLGETHATPILAYQAEFENARRWITYDLLTGRLGPGDPMWEYFRSLGVAPDELAWFRDNPCPPDVIGINHYLSSERFLDERVERYPPSTWGGNSQHRYADVEAARLRAGGASGPAALLRAVWERYRLPIAVTEVHNGCTREEQLRWVVEVWQAAEQARAAGADIRAVTLWALLGSYDWSSLVTREEGRYEPGAFDVRGPVPRPTALAALARTMAAGEVPSHPVLSARGWWHRAERLLYGPAVHGGPERRRRARPLTAPEFLPGQPLIVTGGNGTLGRAFARLCRLRGLPCRVLDRGSMDIADAGSVETAMEAFRPWAVVNAAGYVRVDDAETDVERCLRENRDGPALLADACARHGAALVTFSSDLVFDGSAREPYVESDTPRPLNVYGRSKAEGERLVLDRLASALVVRTSAFFGPWDDYNFITLALRALAAGGTWTAGSATVTATYVPDLVNAALDLLIDGESGIWHLANPGPVTWADLGRRAAHLAGLDARRIVAHEPALPARRPAWSPLGSERGVLLPPLDDALARYVGETGIRERALEA